MLTEARHAIPIEFSELISLAPVSARAKDELAAAMEARGRYYHTTKHLAQLWRRHRRHAAAEGFDGPEIEKLIACAIAYHDSVYDMKRRDNEDRSADYWLAASHDADLPERDKDWVAGTIRATADHMAYHPAFDVEHPPRGNGAVLRERARVWVLDLDLTPLGETVENFDHNTACLRREAAQISDPDWRKGQKHFLTGLLDAPRIYRTPTLHEIYEDAARDNIKRLLARIAA